MRETARARATAVRTHAPAGSPGRARVATMNALQESMSEREGMSTTRHIEPRWRLATRGAHALSSNGLVFVSPHPWEVASAHEVAS